MTMETKFQQGPNGLSDQGDPMVFEFTGDDDMWVYVDDVLLLDIGGVHDAFHGTINFQTGRIHVDGQKTGDETTYIKEQYWQAHQFPDGSAWNDRDDPRQHLFFINGGEDNGKLRGTYLDYSPHNLKMFYMERGAGASNLQIRFNLPVITGDEFRVTKNMLTTASGQPIQSEYSNAKFYYKAYIKQGNDWGEYKRTDFPAGKTAVYDEDGYPAVEWKNDSIFEVKPGQTAVIPVGDDQVEYKVFEVEPESGSHMLDLFNVSNSDEDPADSKSTTGKTVQRRSQVFFDNKPVDDIVNELRITKKLHGSLYTDSQTSSGLVEDQNGSPYFEIRIYLESTGGQLVPYSLGEYYQIDGETGAYIRKDGGTPALNIPENLPISGDLFDPPMNVDSLPVTVNAANGTIITDRDAEVTIHNRVNTDFIVPLEKNWSEDFSGLLNNQTQVSFTLKRYKLSDRGGAFTLLASTAGQPTNFDPVYIFTNEDTGERFTVRYSEMTENGNNRSKTLTLPVGSYIVTIGDDPVGYNTTHTQTASELTVSASEAATGAIASPASITINSTYTRQSGSIQVTKTLAGYHGNSSFEKFTATYSVTDLAGRAVKDIYGRNVTPVTLSYSNFTEGNTKVFTFDNLPSGQYIVREAVAGSSFNNEKYTVVSTCTPESGIVTVAEGPAATAAFSSTYTQVLSNPVRIFVHETAYGRDISLYNNSTSFRPGDQVAITFMYSYNNNDIKYCVNEGAWKIHLGYIQFLAIQMERSSPRGDDFGPEVVIPLCH